MITRESRRIAGILLGGPAHGAVWRSCAAGDADRSAVGIYAEPVAAESVSRRARACGVLLVLSLVALRYVDEARLPEGWKHYVRASIPSAAIFLPAGFFFSVLSPHATAPNGFIYLAYVGAAVLAVGLLAWGWVC